MSGSTGLPPVPLFITYAANEAKFAAGSVAPGTQAGALLAYFQKVAPTITSPDALLKNYKALTVVLGAFGLQDKIGQTAVLRQLLTQNPASKTSLAQTIGNAKFLAFAQALSDWTKPPFATAAGLAKIVQPYTLNTFEAGADAQAPGLANALYFARQAASLKSVTALQTDASLLKVVVTSVGLPVQDFDLLDFDQQTAILKSKVTISNFQSPTYVKQAAEQYLVSQQSQTDNGPAAGSVASLYSDGVDTSGDSVLSILDPTANTDGSGSATDSGANTLSLFA